VYESIASVPCVNAGRLKSFGAEAFVFSAPQNVGGDQAMSIAGILGAIPDST
jgi:hypothetical protein